MDKLAVWPPVTDWVSPGVKHLQLLPEPAAAEGRHASPCACHQLSFPRSAWDQAVTWAGKTLHPHETRVHAGSFKSLAAPSSGARTAFKVPPGGVGRAGTQHLQQPGAALPKPPSLAGGEARARKPTFLSRSYTLDGRSRPGTADLG